MKKPNTKERVKKGVRHPTHLDFGTPAGDDKHHENVRISGLHFWVNS